MTTDNAGFDFTEALQRRQATLQASLAEGRTVHNHPTASGDHSELDWRGTLGRFLPNRYRISQGTVVDATGATSDAIDVIIHDAQYTPILFQRDVGDDGSITVPAESVYAVFEAKPRMDKGHLQYASAKVDSVRSLHRTSTPITHAGGSYDPKPPHRIIGGLLADVCGWKPCLGQPFVDTVTGFSGNGILDLGCALTGGAFELREPLDPAREWTLDTSPPDLTLMFFLVRLFRRLQTLGTAPAIDIEAYAPAVFLGDS